VFKFLLVSLLTVFAFGSATDIQYPDLTMTWVGFSALAIFLIGYYFIATEDKYHIDKSKPALFIGTFMLILAAALFNIWARFKFG